MSLGVDRAGKKIPWNGKVVSIQPRIRLLRSFDQRSHNYLGYSLRIKGLTEDQQREFVVGIGKGTQSKHMLRAGDAVSGLCEPIEDSNLETVEFYRVSKLKVLEQAAEAQAEPPPWLGVPPELEVYRQREGASKA